MIINEDILRKKTKFKSNLELVFIYYKRKIHKEKTAMESSQISRGVAKSKNEVS